VWRPTVAESAIHAAKKFGAEQLDTAAAHAALTAGRPFLVGLPEGGNPACHAALLVPGDPKVWIVNRSSMPSDGVALARETDQYGCDNGTTLSNQVLNAPAPTPPLDEAAKAAAQRAGRPFLYALPDHSEPACHTAVVLPSGAAWFLNGSGGASAEGDALDRELLQFGCDSGVERPAGGAR